MMIWQTKQWGKMLLASKQADNVFDIGGIQVERRSLGMGQFGLFIIGLDYTKPGIESNTLEVEKYLIDLVKTEKALFIQVEVLNYSGELKDKFFDLQYISFGHYKQFIYPYSAVINLEQSEDEILAGMKPKGRYNIKLARKKGVEVKLVEENPENIKVYYELMKETTTRDKFSGNTLEYYTKFLKYIDDSFLLIAYNAEGKPIAGGIFILGKEATLYYYGASSSQPEDRKLMAPYLIQWEAILKAKEFGSKLYDFLGVAPEGYENHPLEGVTNFKRKFTSDVRKVSEEYIYINKKFIYKILVILRSTKTFIKVIIPSYITKLQQLSKVKKKDTN